MFKENCESIYKEIHSEKTSPMYDTVKEKRKRIRRFHNNVPIKVTRTQFKGIEDLCLHLSLGFKSLFSIQFDEAKSAFYRLKVNLSLWET